MNPIPDVVVFHPPAVLPPGLVSLPPGPHSAAVLHRHNGRLVDLLVTDPAAAEGETARSWRVPLVPFLHPNDPDPASPMGYCLPEGHCVVEGCCVPDPEAA